MRAWWWDINSATKNNKTRQFIAFAVTVVASLALLFCALAAHARWKTKFPAQSTYGVQTRPKTGHL